MPGARTTPRYDEMKEQVIEALRLQFRPEFLNRVDEVIVFHALTDAEPGCHRRPAPGRPASDASPSTTWRSS